MGFIDFSAVVPWFNGKRVVIVGGAPSSSLNNEPGCIDGHDVVVRVNNYRTGERQGRRCDVFYSFFGGSIKKTVEELKADGVRLCMSKVPNSWPIASAWHVRNRKLNGVDFRYIYEARKDWWFCPTYVPGDLRFQASFGVLNRHIPTTGFAAILDVLDCCPSQLYLTGFDFFTSKLHNVNEPWRQGRSDDPIGHRPELELAWLRANVDRYPLALDAALESMVHRKAAA